MKEVVELALILSAKDMLSGVLGSVTKSLSGLGMMGDDTAKKIATLGDRGGSSGAKLAAVGAVMTGAVAGGIAYAGIKAVESAGNFQQMSTVLQTSAGESADKMAMVRQGMLDISSSTGTAIEALNGANGAMYQVESAGFHGADGLLLLKAAAQGAKAEGADVTKVADALSSAMKDYSLPASSAADVTSKLVAAVGAGKANFEQFSGSLHSVLPFAAAMNESLDDVLGSMASMTVHGMSADQASQDLAHTLQKMQTPTRGMTDELSQLGIKSTDLAGMIGSKGLSGTLETISETIMSKMGPSGKVMLDAFNGNKVAASDMMQMIAAMPPSLQKMAQAYVDGGMSLGDYRKEMKNLPTDQAQLMQQFQALAGKAHGFSGALKSGINTSQSYSQALQAATGDSTTMATALLLTRDNAQTTADAVGAVSRAHAEAGGNVAGWAVIQGNFNQKLSVATNTLKNTGIAIGTALLPPLTQLLGVVINILTPITSWISKNPQLAAGIMITVGALAAVISSVLTFMVVATKIGKIVTEFKELVAATKAFGLASKVFGAFKTMTTAVQEFNIALKLQAAGTKIAAAAQWLMNSALWANPITWIVIAVIALIAVIVLMATHWKEVSKVLGDVWNAITSAVKVGVDAVVKFFQDLWKGITQVVTNIINWVKQNWQLLLVIFLGPMGLLIGFVISHFNQIKQVITNVVNGIINFFKAAWDIISKVVYYAFLIMLGLVILGLRAIWNVIGPPLTAIWNFFVTIFTNIYNFIKAIWTAYFNFIVGVARAVVSAIMTALTAAWHFIVQVFTTVWNFIVDIFTRVLNFYIGIYVAIWNTTVSVLTTVWNFIVQVFTTVWNFIVDVFTRVWNFYVAIFTAIYNTIASALQRVWNFIVSIFNAVWGFISSVWNSIWSTISAIWNNIVNTVGNALQNVWNNIMNVVNNIKNFFAGAGGWLVDAGKNMIQGLVNGIQGMADNVVNTAKNIAKSAVDAAKQFLGIHSPSTVFMEIGDYSMQGMQKGIEDNAHKVTDATKNVAASTVKTANTTLAAQSHTAAGVPIATTAQAQQQGNVNVSLTIKVGMFTGSAQEANEAAQIIWQGMNRIAKQHNLSFPQIGLIPN